MNKIWVLVWKHQLIERKTNILTFYEKINVHETQGLQNITAQLPYSSPKYLLNVFLMYLDNTKNLISNIILWRYFMFFPMGFFIFLRYPAFFTNFNMSLCGVRPLIEGIAKNELV